MSNQNQGRGRPGEAAISKSDRTPERKSERVSMSQSEFLAVDTEAGYHYRWFDAKKEGRIAQAKAAWYEPVLDSEGLEVRRQKHGGELLLMRIPDEYWREDFKNGQHRVNEQAGEKVETLDRNPLAPDYIPDGKTRVASPEKWDGI